MRMSKQCFIRPSRVGLLLVSVGLAAVLSGSVVVAADPITVLRIGQTIYSAGKSAYTIASSIEGTLWHDWSVCEYEDGFRLYNRFKRKRFDNGGQEVINYWSFGGDGDSFYGAGDGNEHRVNLPEDRAYIERIHGRITLIAQIDNPPSCKRDDEIVYIGLHPAQNGTPERYTIHCSDAASAPQSKSDKAVKDCLKCP